MLAYVGFVYLLVVGLIMAPSWQAVFVCMQWTKHVQWANFETPSHQFLLGVRNVRLHSSDGVELGAWHALPSSAFNTLGALRASSADAAATASIVDDATFDDSLRGSDLSDQLVVLFLHGNGEHRAAKQGPIHVRAISAYLDSHALALDYRGFGDSSGWPTEEGLALDARAAWEWLTLVRGVRPSRVLIWGHSLGSGVAARLASEVTGAASGQLASEGPLGLVLESAFSSLPELVPDYPLGRAICWLPAVRSSVSAGLSFRLNTTKQLRALAHALPELPVLLLHGEQDTTVPCEHSRRLFAQTQAAGATGVRLVTLPGTDHHTVLAHPDAISAVTRLIHEARRGAMPTAAVAAEGRQPQRGARTPAERARPDATRRGETRENDRV